MQFFFESFHERPESDEFDFFIVSCRDGGLFFGLFLRRRFFFAALPREGFCGPFATRGFLTRRASGCRRRFGGVRLERDCASFIKGHSRRPGKCAHRTFKWKRHAGGEVGEFFLFFGFPPIESKVP